MHKIFTLYSPLCPPSSSFLCVLLLRELLSSPHLRVLLLLETSPTRASQPFLLLEELLTMLITRLPSLLLERYVYIIYQIENQSNKICDNLRPHLILFQSFRFTGQPRHTCCWKHHQACCYYCCFRCCIQDPYVYRIHHRIFNCYLRNSPLLPRYERIQEVNS